MANLWAIGLTSCNASYRRRFSLIFESLHPAFAAFASLRILASNRRVSVSPSDERVVQRFKHEAVKRQKIQETVICLYQPLTGINCLIFF